MFCALPLAAIVLSACGAQPPQQVEVTRVVEVEKLTDTSNKPEHRSA